MYMLKSVVLLLSILKLVMCHVVAELNLPMTKPKMKELAGDVCYDLQRLLRWDENKKFRCEREFLELPEYSKLISPEAKVKCSLDNFVSLKVVPNTNYYTILLLQPLKETEYRYYVFEPEESQVALHPQMNGTIEYRVWTNVITSKGVLGVWRAGSKIRSSQNQDTARIPFGLRRVGDFLYSNKTVTATFQWDTADGDCEIDVTSYCDEPINSIGLLPVEVESSRAIATNLTPGSKCTIKIRNRAGSNETLEYYVPACQNFVDNGQCLPSPPEILNITTTAAGEAGYDVTVLWAAPLHPPTTYNVTLYTDIERTIVLPGDAVEATFPGAQGSEFVVSVVAVTDAGSGHATRSHGRFLYG